MGSAKEDEKLGRRDLFRRGALAGLSAGLLPLMGPSRAGAKEQVRGTVKRYASLGRTGFKISDISFGGSRLGAGEEDIVRDAFDRGINYFDTADSYRGGDSEITIGNALKGKRDKVFIASKTHTTSYQPKRAMMGHLEGSLRRLQTDYVDVYFNHAVNDVDRLQNPEWYEFLDEAKKQGKIRATGVSGHAGNLISCLDYALDHDAVDVILVAYNFGQDPKFFERFTRSFDFIARQPDLPRVLEKARAKNIGVVAMKTLMGARLNDMRPFEKGGATYSQAAFRWVLSNPDVDALIISMVETDLINEYLGASGWTTAARGDIDLLEGYARMAHMSYCRHACNDCESACPYGVSIADVLRTRMYAVDYGDARLARDEYARLGAGASACLTCPTQACAGSCTYGLPVEKLVGPTHRMLARRNNTDAV